MVEFFGDADRGLLVVGDQVRVGVHRETQRVVTQPDLNAFGVHAPLERHRRKGVAEGVETSPRCARLDFPLEKHRDDETQAQGED